MKSSTCQEGTEQYEEYDSFIMRRKLRKLVQYDYRTSEGKLFSCIAKTLKQARQRRDKWLATL